MDSCKHVFERPKWYNITEFCADGDPNYAVVNLKCSICGMVGSAIANIEWGGIMVVGKSIGIRLMVNAC